MTVYRKPSFTSPVGDFEGPDTDGNYWARSLGSNERAGPFQNQEAAIEFLTRDAGCTAEFYIEGGLVQHLQ